MYLSVFQADLKIEGGLKRLFCTKMMLNWHVIWSNPAYYFVNATENEKQACANGGVQV